MSGMEALLEVEAKAFIEQDQEYIRSFRRNMHQHPELSYKEFATTQRIAAELEKLPGVEVTTWEGKTGVMGVLKGGKPGKVLALRADIDALPMTEKSGLPFHSLESGVAHSCGHDLHTSVLLGTARAMSQVRENLPGTVKFIFQCAEEALGGSESMIERGVLDDPKPDAIFGLHTWPFLPAGTIGFKAGSFMASADSLDVVIEGKSGHAAHPDNCVDPIVAAAAVIQGVQSIVSRELPPTKGAVVSFCVIQGGTARNVIAPSVTLQGTVRTTDTEVRNSMEVRLRRIITSIAAGYRCKAKITYTKGPAPVMNDAALTDLARNAVKAALGEEQVSELAEPSLGSEDFSAYQERIPGVLYRLGTANDNPQSKLGMHNPAIIFDEKALPTGITAMTSVALAYLEK